MAELPTENVEDESSEPRADMTELVYRALEPEAMSFREEADGGAVLFGRMMPYNEWTEVNSRIEGNFMERFAPGSLVKTMSERAKQIRVLFQHGKDFLGQQPIAIFNAFRDEPDGGYYEASLLRGLPDLLIEGLKQGVYGTSIRFRAIPGKFDSVFPAKRSEHNPKGLEERTIREAHVREFSVVTFPQYDGATASVRSLTDEVAARALLGDPMRLLEVLQSIGRMEPQHSAEREDAPVEPSRSTRPGRDYLTREEDPAWRL